MSGAPPNGRPQSRACEKILEALPQTYFQEVAQAFDRAVAATGAPREFHLDLAGLKICLRFAGEALVPVLMPTLSHLISAQPGPADLTICCWDDKTTGSQLPEPSPTIRYNHLRNCLHAVSNHRFQAFFQEWMGSLSCIDLQDGIAYAGYWDAQTLPMYEVAAPMRPLFNALFNRRGRQLVHAASVGSAGGSLLLAGPAKSGKSTLAVQCLLAGMDYQSDDLCVISEEQPRSWSIYDIAKLREDSLPRLGSAVPPLSYFEEGTERKAYFRVSHHFPHQPMRELPIRALVIPRITGTGSRLTKASRLDAMRALVPWSVSEVPAADTFGEKIMLKALSRFPAWHLELGPDFTQTRALLESLLHG